MPRRAKPEEDDAARLFTHITGIPLAKNDDGSQNSQVDFLYATNPPGGAVEVTTYTSATGKQASAEWGRSQRDLYVAPELQHSWLVTVNERTRFRDLAQRIRSALRTLELEKLLHFSDDWQWSSATGTLAEAIRTLVENGVTDADIIDTKPPAGQIHVSSSGAATAGHPNDALSDLEAYTVSDAMSDVRHKLKATGLRERHAFVWVDYMNKFSTAHPIVGPDIPERAPKLPSEITNIWFVVRQGVGWRWAPELGWLRFEFTLGPTNQGLN